MVKVIALETHDITQSNVLKETLAIRILAYVIQSLCSETNSPAACSDVILPVSITSLEIRWQLILSEN